MKMDPDPTPRPASPAWNVPGATVQVARAGTRSFEFNAGQGHAVAPDDNSVGNIRYKPNCQRKVPFPSPRLRSPRGLVNNEFRTGVPPV